MLFNHPNWGRGILWATQAEAALANQRLFIDPFPIALANRNARRAII